MHTGPNIERDGLVLALDAASPRCYPGNGTSVNSIIGTPTGTLFNGVGFYPEIASGTWRFDGVNDYLRIDDVLVSNPTSLTIGGWFKRNGDGANYETALHHSTNTSIGASSYWFGLETNSNNIVGTIGANTGRGWAAGKTEVVANLGEWYHVTSTWDGSEVKTYVNGDLEKTYSLTSYNNLTTPTRIGASGDGNGYTMNADIAHIFIAENKHYSSSEVLQNYNAQKSRFGL